MRSGPSRTTINFWLDALLLILLLAQVWIALIFRFVFPPGPNADGWTLWGGSFVRWCDAQFALHCAFAFAVLLHVMLHWSWVWSVAATQFTFFRRKNKRVYDDGTRTVYGVALLIALLVVMGMATGAASLAVRPPS